MPKGVGHLTHRDMAEMMAHVRATVMPKGVGHSWIIGANSRRSGCELL